MWYNLKNGIELQKFRDRCVELQNKAAMVEVVEKKPKSLQQLKYLHLMLSYFGLQFGYSMAETKTHFFKLVVNKDIFVREGTTGSLVRFTPTCVPLPTSPRTK